MFKKLADQIRPYIPIGQIAVIVLTGTIALHSVAGLFLKSELSGPVIERVRVNMPVDKRQETLLLRFRFRVLRMDCGPIEYFNIFLTDKFGRVHGVQNSLVGQYLRGDQSEIQTRVKVPALISNGLAMGHGNIVHNCPEGRVLLELPEWNTIILPRKQGYGD